MLYPGLPSACCAAADHLRNTLQIGCLCWGSFEALRFWLRMRRRLALGLANPEVANRFLLWGIGAGTAGLGSAIGTLFAIVTGVSYLEAAWMVALLSGLGFIAAVAMWLAFLPPATYTRWILAKASPRAFE